MAKLTVILWRDIPAQVVARDGRRTVKTVLHPRFQTAIDRAATRADKRTYDAYIGEWRKEERECGAALEAEVHTVVDRLESEFTNHRLAQLILSGGTAAASALTPPGGDLPDRPRPR